jgi:filamentous hemagglutinin family protein
LNVDEAASMTVCNVSGGAVHRRHAAPLRGMLLGSTVLVAVAQQAAAQPAINAQPQGGRVVAGTATIGQTATLTQIDQTSQRAAINWNSFDVGSKQQVQFQQPSASAMTLNRVTGADPSQIAGQVTANGQIVLVNPAGVLFTKGAQVQAQSVVVSAAGISDQNFMAGRMVFDQPGRPDAAVVNQGRITVKQTGLAGLVAPRVENDGVISAKLGHVVLGGAQTATLDLYGDGLLSIDVTGQVKQANVGKDGKTAAALVTNTGTVLADGGTVLLTASAVDGVVQTLVTAGGNISAPSVGGRTGRIAVRGTGGAVLVTGGVLAQGGQPGTTGGQIELNASGAVTLASTARVDASGQAGGGTIAVGTTLARAKGGPSVVGQKTAAKTTVAAGAMIAADATAMGNGGQITVLSTEGTSMAGSTTARGGPQGGDGGNVEISANHGLTITGTVDTRAPAGKTGLLTIDPDTLTIGDNVVTANPAAPAADGSNQPATGAQTISAATFNAFTTNVSLQATGDITLGGSTPLATATTGASLSLSAGGTLTVNVALDQNGPVALSGTGGITINARINIGSNRLDLTTGPDGLGAGTITQTAGGAITAGMLTGETNGVVDLSAATNAISALGTFFARGSAFTLNNGATPLSLAGEVYSNGTLTLNAGAVTETPTAFIFASVLQGTAPSFVLLNSTNAIQGGIRLNATAGDIRIFNGGPLLLDATTTTGNIYLATSNPEGLEISTPDVLSAPGGTVTLQSDVVVVLGKISAATFEVAPYTQGLPVNLGGTLVNGELVLPSLAGVTAGTVRIGAVSVPGTSGLTTTAGSIVVGGTFDASGTKLELNTTGGISGNGALTASTLSGSVAGAIDLSTASNSIGSLGTLSTGSKDFNLNNGANPLTITGAVNLGATGTLTLKAGKITEPTGGSITVGTLTGSSSDAVDLGNAANAVAALGAFTATGDFSLTNGANKNLTVTGPLSANNITLSTSGAGTLSVQGAVTTTGNNGTVTLTGGGGGIVLNAAVGAGAGTTGPIVDLITTGGGDVTQILAPSGITAAELIGSVSGSAILATLAGGQIVSRPINSIAALGSFTVSGSSGFVLDASGTLDASGKPGTLTVNGPLTAKTGPLTISKPNGLAVTGTITANGAVDLTDDGGGTTITGNVKAPTIALRPRQELTARACSLQGRSV